MKNLFLSPFCLMFLMLAPQLQANDFELGLSSETAQLTFRSDSSLIGWGGADLGFGVFYNDTDDVIGQMSIFQARQASEQSRMTFGVGIRAYAGRLDAISENIVSLAIGGEIRYTFPGVMPMSAYFQVFFAPKITSFADAEEVRDYLLGFQIEALPQTVAFVGIRHLEFDTEDVSGYQADDEHLHIGVRLTF